jgi:hypothetical protein
MSLCDFNRLGGVVIGVLELTVVDCGFEFRSCQAKYFKIGICCAGSLTQNSTSSRYLIRLAKQSWVFFLNAK